MELTVELTQGQIEGHFEGLRSSDADVRRIALVALQRLQPPALEQLFEIYDPDDHGLVWGETAANSIRFILRTIHSAMVLKLGNSDRRVRSAALVAMARLEPADLSCVDPVLLAQHADAVVAMLDDPAWPVQKSALGYLRILEPAAQLQYRDAIAARLEDPNWDIRYDALWMLGWFHPATIAKYAGIIAATLDEVSNDDIWFRFAYDALNALGKLEPEALVQYASTVAAKLDYRLNPGVRGKAFDTLSALPHYITRGIDFTSEELRTRVVTHSDFSDLRSRLVGRAGWYRYLQRMRGRPIAIYWYALPYRPGGPGYVRDVEAWDHIG